MISTLLAIAFMQATPAIPAVPSLPPRLSLEQQAALRCSAAFAMVAQGQEARNTEALQYPAMAERGREFFVRSSARIMEETQMSREHLAQALAYEAQELRTDGKLGTAMTPCLLLLEASGL